MFLTAARSVSIVRVCPESEKEYLSKYTLSVPLGALEWNWFPPEVVAQWFEKSDQFPDPPTQKYFDALSAHPFILTDVPFAVFGHKSTGLAIPSESESALRFEELFVWIWGKTTPWISKTELSASFTLSTSFPSGIPPNVKPRECLKLSEKIDIGVVDDSVAVPPLISKIKSEGSRSPLPFTVEKTFSLKVTITVRLSDDTSALKRLALTVPSLTELLLWFWSDLLPSLSKISLYIGLIVSTSLPAWLEILSPKV